MQSEHILQKYEPHYVEPIEEVDSMEGQSLISAESESHDFHRYYSGSDSEQTFDYKVSEIQKQTLEEGYKISDNPQYCPYSGSIGSFNDPYPSAPSKYSDEADIDYQDLPERYEPQDLERIEEVDIMERELLWIPKFYYSDSDSEQSFDYKVSDIPYQKLEEDDEISDYSQSYPYSSSVGSFYDPYPDIPYQLLVNESDNSSSDTDSDYIDDNDMTFHEDQEQAECVSKLIDEADPIDSREPLLRPDNHHISELMDEKALQHEMPAIGRGHVLDVSYRKLTQNNTSRNPSLLKHVLIRNTITRLEEEQQKESFEKHI